jgi:hypothetical protein
MIKKDPFTSLAEWTRDERARETRELSPDQKAYARWLLRNHRRRHRRSGFFASAPYHAIDALSCGIAFALSLILRRDVPGIDDLRLKRLAKAEEIDERKLWVQSLTPEARDAARTLIDYWLSQIMLYEANGSNPTAVRELLDELLTP